MSYAEPSVHRLDSGWKVEVRHEGESIARLWIVDRAMRIGSAVVRVGGIAGVGTDREHRRRGLALRVLRRSLELLAREGYAASFLFGIPDFYHRVGFATCMPEHGLLLDTVDAERASSDLRTRPLRRADLEKVRRIYERDNAFRTASVVRGRAWSGFPMGSGFAVPGVARVVHAADTPSRVRGYLLVDDDPQRCRAAEVGGAGEAVQAAILSHLARRAVSLRKEILSASVPVDHPFALYCRRLGCRDDTRYPRAAGPMGRVIDLSRFVRALVPEWESLWPPGASDGLTIGTDIGAVTLHRRRNGRLNVVARVPLGGARLRLGDPSVLMQLTMGYRSAADAIAAGQLRCSRGGADLAHALFPLRVAHMWWPDRF